MSGTRERIQVEFNRPEHLKKVEEFLSYFEGHSRPDAFIRAIDFYLRYSPAVQMLKSARERRRK